MNFTPNSDEAPEEVRCVTPATVFVCENPAVVRKAERELGAHPARFRKPAGTSR